MMMYLFRVLYMMMYLYIHLSKSRVPTQIRALCDDVYIYTCEYTYACLYLKSVFGCLM